MGTKVHQTCEWKTHCRIGESNLLPIRRIGPLYRFQSSPTYKSGKTLANCHHSSPQIHLSANDAWRNHTWHPLVRCEDEQRKVSGHNHDRTTQAHDPRCCDLLPDARICPAFFGKYAEPGMAASLCQRPQWWGIDLKWEH